MSFMLLRHPKRLEKNFPKAKKETQFTYRKSIEPIASIFFLELDSRSEKAEKFVYHHQLIRLQIETI